jgi:hypothetical protein
VVTKLLTRDSVIVDEFSTVVAAARSWTPVVLKSSPVAWKRRG